MLSKWQCRRLQVLSERAIQVIRAINSISLIRRILNLIFGSTLHSDLTCIFISLLLNQGFNISISNYNLKTRYTVILRYHAGNIPKLIFFDTAQCHTHTHTHTHTHMHTHTHTRARARTHTHAHTCTHFPNNLVLRMYTCGF